ncbi:hypothetical protein HB991_16435 [Yersinia mollaretii]|uniref:Uncharacterized protein n=1 Tax=Yersinia mollaretii TaxID=33060 RepID=A0AA44I0W0_YERMO|nr:hypothetical protein [Yersinia mollaretii]CNK35274.1 Uncharacterised protein [Yersinia enterocolitica]NIL24088.1 hypothetical protein [Yersinia mollaretii]CNI97945.1 Uncharacterised protein [Yersinia mollaretii]CNK51021.1 Uncharacterised protein [Yersinia mollaretii]CQQ75372.1 Uncharacterised protein [Yersinia mollaretii]
MIKLILLSTIMLTTLNSFASKNYDLTGKINGIRISNDRCYISFEANNSPYYSNGWHFSDSEAICKISQMAYILGKPVRATCEIDTNNMSYANTVKSIIIGIEGIHWPPYHKQN